MSTPMVPALSLCKLLQNMPGKNATTAKRDSVVHEPKEHILSFLTDADQAPDVDNEFAPVELCSRFLTRRP